MPDPKAAFIDPQAALAALTPQLPKAALDLGPSGPHFDDDVEEAPVQVGEGLPPILKDAEAKPAEDPRPHYTNVLDGLWPEFDDPEERTAGRLMALHREVRDEAWKVGLLKSELWESWSAFKIPQSERERFDKDFTQYLRRLNAYRKELDLLAPSSMETEDVYIGLVKRRDGAGPVPDAIMHLYFAQQLGLLKEHAQDMSAGFMGRVMTGLESAAKASRDTLEDIEDVVEDKSSALDDAAAGLKKLGWWILGGVVGTVALGGTVAAVVLAAKHEPGTRLDGERSEEFEG